MLREIYIDKFHKKYTETRPQVFSGLTISESRLYNRFTQLYQIYDQRQSYQLYISHRPLQPCLQEIHFVEVSPKLIILTENNQNIILEEKTKQNLFECLYDQETKLNMNPYMEELLSRQLLLELKEQLLSYKKHNIDYDAIHPQNVVNRGQWELSAAGLLIGNQKQSQTYYKPWVVKEGRQAYALGTLFFQLHFGFAPFEEKHQKVSFSFKDYLSFLDTGKQQVKQALKIYFFAQRLLQLSQQGKHLIEASLRGDMTFEAFYSHQYFQRTPGTKKRQANFANREIKMLGEFGQAYQSLVLAAINHRKKHPEEKLYQKLPFTSDLSKKQIIQQFKKNPILGQIRFDNNFLKEKVVATFRQQQHDEPINMQYFYRQESFDPQTDYPCRDLMKMIQEILTKRKGKQSQATVEKKIKLYAYPYAMIFQLVKIKAAQSRQIKQQINRTIQDLLQVSQLFYAKQFVAPLHHTHLAFKTFQEIKIRFRTGINELYKHFLKEAMRKYNIKKDMMNPLERAKQRKIGLEYYRLCLKLMQCSVLVRKQGSDLDLNRIETSQRKEVQNDLNELLKTYFPNKIELS